MSPITVQFITVSRMFQLLYEHHLVWIHHSATLVFLPSKIKAKVDVIKVIMIHLPFKFVCGQQNNIHVLHTAQCSESVHLNITEKQLLQHKTKS